MHKIFVDPQGNWQPHQSWQDDVVENQPEQFAFYEVEELPNGPSRFIDGEFEEIVIESSEIEEVDLPEIDPIAVWDFIADQMEMTEELNSRLEELEHGENG